MNEITNKPKGDIRVIMHKGGKYDTKTGTIIGGEVLRDEKDHNLIVNDASLLISSRMAPPDLNTDKGTRYDYGLQCLAIGYDEDTSHEEDTGRPELYGEIYRRAFDDWGYVHTNDDNTQELKKDDVTNQIQYITTFPAGTPSAEGSTDINEMGLFGGNCDITKDSYTKDENGKPKQPGKMFNYKRFSTWSKPVEAQMTIVWTITY